MQEKHLSSHIRTGWAERQFPEVLSTVFGSIYYSHILWQHEKRDGPQLPVLSMPIQLSGELLEQFKALFPVLPAHRTPCAGHSILRESGMFLNDMEQTVQNKLLQNVQFKAHSYFTSQAHQPKRNIHVCVTHTLKHTAPMCLVASG